MASLFPAQDPLFVYILLGGIGGVLAVIAVVYLKKRQQVTSAVVKKARAPAGRLAYQPEARPVPVLPQSMIPRRIRKTPVFKSPKEVSLISGRADITQSFRALAEKYVLDQFTIATTDGLVFASSGGGDAGTDAAHYGGTVFTPPVPETPGVVLAGISHKGSGLVLIIRTPVPVPEEVRKNIVEDTKDILNWWI